MDRAKLCPLLCLLCVNIFAQPAGSGVISGTVIDAASGDAVKKAIVTVTWHGTPRAWGTMRTDGSGRFVFERLPAGKYDLSATKAGLGTANYGANSIRELADVITLGEGEVHGDIKLRFLRSGTISGTVFDPDGDPVAGVTVTLLRPDRRLGERILTNINGIGTNDRGEYKLTGLDPGEYYVRCIPNMPRMGPMIIGGVAETSRARPVAQYFGGARESKDAAPVILRGGDTLTGIDFHLTAERPATITGHVAGVPPMDQPDPSPNGPMSGRVIGHRGNPQGIFISLSAASDDEASWGNWGFGANPPDYRFEIPDQPPGRYLIEAAVRGKDKTYFAFQLVDAHEGTNEIVLAVVPAVEVKGHLKFEGAGEHPVESFAVTLTSPGPRGGDHSATVKKDGSFAIEDVPPGEWVLNVTPNRPGLFQKSAHLGDKDVLLKRMEITPGLDAPLNIVLSSNTATVSGEVDDKRAGILLAPVGKWHTYTRFYDCVIADDAGKFKMDVVVPGKYKIFALEKIATTSYCNPESADLLDAFGEELDVTEGAKVESHPQLIPQEKAREILKP
jgi:hypothetical protein